MVATNGFHRMRIKEEKKLFLVDIMAAMNTEVWAIQMRANARGSDGLAEVNQLDMENILVPLLDDVKRKELKPFVEQLYSAKASFGNAVQSLLIKERGSVFDIEARPTHSALV